MCGYHETNVYLLLVVMKGVFIIYFYLLEKTLYLLIFFKQVLLENKPNFLIQLYNFLNVNILRVLGVGAYKFKCLFVYVRS